MKQIEANEKSIASDLRVKMGDFVYLHLFDFVANDEYEYVVQIFKASYFPFLENVGCFHNWWIASEMLNSLINGR